jgi:hypothetical protein
MSNRVGHITSPGLKAVAAGVILGLGLAGHAAAAPMIYTTEPAFQTAASGIPLATEGFNQAASEIGITSKTFGDVTVSATTNFAVLLGAGTDGGTSSLLWIGSGTNPITFSFAQSINAFGIDFIGLGDGSDPTTLSVSLDGGVFTDVLTNFTGAPSNVQFAGIVDTMAPFSSISFLSTALGDGAYLDRAQYGAIPEPSTLVLFTMGVAGLGFARRRHRRRNHLCGQPALSPNRKGERGRYPFLAGSYAS